MLNIFVSPARKDGGQLEIRISNSGFYLVVKTSDREYVWKIGSYPRGFSELQLRPWPNTCYFHGDLENDLYYIWVAPDEGVPGHVRLYFYDLGGQEFAHVFIRVTEFNAFCEKFESYWTS